MSKKTKIQPVIIISRDGALGVVSALVEKKLSLATAQLKVETEIEAIRKRYQPHIDELTTNIACLEAGLQVWSQSHPDEFPKGAKSIDLPQARFGFRLGPPKCDKIKAKDTWDDIVHRLASVIIPAKDPETDQPILDESGEPIIAFRGEDYIAYGSPSVDKAGILRHLGEIPPEALALAGIRIEQEEFFFFEPKSDLIDTTSTSTQP